MESSSPHSVIGSVLLDTSECVSAVRRTLYPFMGMAVDVFDDYLPYIQGLVEKMIYGESVVGFDFQDAFFADRIPSDIVTRLEVELNQMLGAQLQLNDIDLTDTFVTWNIARDMYLIMKVNKRHVIRSDFDLLITELHDVYRDNHDMPRRVRSFLGIGKHG